MMRNSILKMVVIFFFTSCAKEGLPPGGPVDRTPPSVVRTLPEQGQVGVDPEVSVQVWFDEGIQSRNASDAVFISPNPGEGVKVRWSAKKCTIHFPKPLDADRTVVVTFGSGIQDYHNNHLEGSYTLAFSTGPVVDEGEITGRVYGVQDASGVDVWAYGLNQGDDPDPLSDEPTYIVQCNKQGRFIFSHISPGRYRIFAVRDRISDRIYQPVEDEIGVPFRDARVSRSDQTSAGHALRIAREDTTAPALVRATATDRNHLTLRFDKPMALSSLQYDGAATIVSETDSTDTLAIRAIFQVPEEEETIQIVTDLQTAGGRYRISLEQVVDQSGLHLDPLYRESGFPAGAISDSTAPAILELCPAPGEKNASLYDGVYLAFSDALDKTTFNDGFTLVDSAGEGISGKFLWSHPASVIFLPDYPLRSRMTYRAVLRTAVRDLARNTAEDTIYHFTTLNADTLSEIAGEIRSDLPPQSGRIVVRAEQVENTMLSSTQILKKPGPYRIPNLLPGRYLLSCFLDIDADGEVDSGSPYPFEPSEPFSVLEDTVKIRSRWPNEGNDILLLLR